MEYDLLPEFLKRQPGIPMEGYSKADYIDRVSSQQNEPVGAKLDRLEKSFLSTSGLERGAIFREAFRTARNAGLDTFWSGENKKTTLYREEVKQANVTSIPKAQYEQATKQDIPDIRDIPDYLLPRDYHSNHFQDYIAQPLNTLPVPDDVHEREAIEGAYSGITNAVALGALGAALPSAMSMEIPGSLAATGKLATADDVATSIWQNAMKWGKSTMGAFRRDEGMPLEYLFPPR